MSNKLKSKKFKATPKSSYDQESIRMRAQLREAIDEIQDRLEHNQAGKDFAIFALAMRRAGISTKRIYKIMSDADRLFGEIGNSEEDFDKLIKMCFDETQIVVQTGEDDSHCKYTVLGRFEKPMESLKMYYNITRLQQVNPEV